MVSVIFMTMFQGVPVEMMTPKEVLEMALKNLPKGRTSLTQSNCTEDATWKTNHKGQFHLDTYRTIEQTEILTGKNKIYYFYWTFLF